MATLMRIIDKLELGYHFVFLTGDHGALEKNLFTDAMQRFLRGKK